MIFILSKNIHVKKYHTNFRKISDYLLLSISYLILLISIYLNSVNSLSTFYNFSEEITKIISVIPYSIALIFPILVILLTNRKDLE